eukprot:5996391-Amphidinium_carterae.1
MFQTKVNKVLNRNHASAASKDQQAKILDGVSECQFIWPKWLHTQWQSLSDIKSTMQVTSIDSTREKLHGSCGVP